MIKLIKRLRQRYMNWRLDLFWKQQIPQIQERRSFLEREWLECIGHPFDPTSPGQRSAMQSRIGTEEWVLIQKEARRKTPEGVPGINPRNLSA